MDTRKLAHLSQTLSGSTITSPFGFTRGMPTATSLDNFLSPVQFERLAHDIFMWREAIREVELAWNPMRVRLQRMYLDTIENPYIKALIERWNELTTQRDYEIYQVKSGKKVVSTDLSQALKAQTWFEDYLLNINETQLFGYNLIQLGDIVNDAFPNIKPTPRQNIRPDTSEGPILTSLVYAINGLHVTDDPLIDMCNHWIPTKESNGITKCGKGLLYSLGLLEIHLRHITEWNVDYVEMYGMPIKVGKTRKQGNDRKAFENFLRSAGSNAYALLDKGTDDEITYEMASNAGTAWKSYENLESRLKGVASQLVLGHEDAMKSTPGKLGGMQAMNKEGNNINIIQDAKNAKQLAAGNFTIRKINEVSAPKFRMLGKYVGSKIIKDLFPSGYVFGLKNDTEENEVKRRDNTDKTAVSMYVKTLSDAGWDVDKVWLEDRLGVKVTAAIPERKLLEERINETTITRQDE